MELFDRHRLEKEGSGYTLVLYLSNHCTEYSDELGHIRNDKKDDLAYSIKDYVDRYFQNISLNSVKVVKGSMIIADIPYK